MKSAPRFRRYAIACLLVCLALGFAALWLVGSKLTAPTNSLVRIDDPNAVTVRIESTDAIELAGTYWPTDKPAPAVLLLHGNGSNRASLAELGGFLSAQGFAVLAVDLRGHGQSTPARKSFGFYEAADAESALAWLRQRNAGNRVGVIGFSLGGAASLIGPDGPLAADAFVLVGVYPDIRSAIRNRLAIRLGEIPAAALEPMLSYQSYPRLGIAPEKLSPIDAVREVKAPILVVGGGADRNTPPDETCALYKAAGGQGELYIARGVGHNELGGSALADIEPLVLGFLNRTLRARSRDDATN